MALGPVKPRGRQLVDDLFATEPAKPRGRSLVDNLFGEDDTESSYDLSAFAGGDKIGERALANKLAESKTPEFKRQAKVREDATARKAKPIEADSEIERMGETFWQRVRGLGGGGGRLALTGLEEIGIDPNGDAAQWLRGKTQSAEEYAARPIEGAAKAPTIDDIRKGNVGIGNLARFVLEQGASSVADMGVLASGVGILPYVGLQTGSTAQQRAENNNQSDATADDVFKALPSAVASAALEKIGMHGIFGAGAKSVVGRIAQAFGTEALTEAIQSPIEYAGSNLGTDAGFDPMEAANQAVAGAIAGGAMGGGIRGAIETPGAIARRVRGAPVAPGVIEAAKTAAPVITPEDEASPIPTELIAEGKRVAGAATASTDANRILSDNGAPAVGSKVTVNVGGKPRTGTVRDAFVDESDADLGAQPGLSIDLDGGGTMREFFADLQDAGVSIEAASIDPAAMDRAIADMEAGGLSPASTLDAIAETGETPAVPSLDELTPAPAPAAPRVPSGGAFDTNAYMARARRAESGGDDGAANTRSSASGRYQFTDSTFARYYAKVYGGNPPAGSKNDPVIQDRLMKAMTDENIAGLKASGIAVNDSAVYAAHHFGLGGAREMYRDPSSPVDAAIVKANPQFKGMTNAQALAWVGNHIGAQPGAPTAPSSRPTPIEEVERERLVDEPLTTKQVEAPTRSADVVQQPSLAYTSDDGLDQEPPVANGMVRLYHSGAAGEGEAAGDSGRWVSTNRKYASDYRKDTPLFYMDVAENDPRLDPEYPEQSAARGFTFNFETTPDEARNLRPIARAQTAAAPASAPAPAPAPAYTITDTPSGKGIAVANITEAQQAIIAAAVPKARAVANKDGAFVYSAKYRDAIETALSSSTPAKTPAAELTPEQQRASVEVSDTLPGGTPVAEAAAAARAVQARKPARTRSGPVDAVTFLADLGGIQDTEGHALKQRARGQGAGSRDISQFAPGGGHVFRKDGMTIDEAGEALQEAGYFTERPTTTQVLEMLDRSAFENQYRPADIPDVEQRRAERRDVQDREGARVAASAALDAFGLSDANEADIEGIAAFMSDGRSSDEAVESYYRQQAEARSADYYEQTNDDEFDIPFDGPAARSADFGNVEGFERSAPVARAAAGSAAPGRNAVEDRGAQADAFGERDGDQRRALERAAEGRSRAGVAQKAAGSDGGLFDNNASQADLLDARAVASGPTVQPTSFAEAVAKNPERAIFDLSDDQVESIGRRLNQKRKKGESKVAFVERMMSANPGADVRKAAIDTVSAPDARAEQLRKQGAKPAPAPAAVPAPVASSPISEDERAALTKMRNREAKGSPDRANADAILRRGSLSDRPNINRVESEVMARAVADRAVPEPAPAAPPPSAPVVPTPAKYGTENKLVTTDRAEVIRQKLRAKMNNINSGIDPEVLALGAELAVFHIEAGARKFGDFSSRMIADIGESVRPFLRSFYESARYYPGMDAIARDMSTPAQIEEEGNGDQGAVSTGDAGASAQDVQRNAQDGSARRAPDGESEGGRSDVPADQRGRTDASERTAEGRPAPTGDRGTGARDADRVPARESDAGRGRGERAAASDAKRVTGENWSIEPGSLDEARGAAVKARDNVRAIEIVRELEQSGMPATREQQAALAKYVGWGGLKNAFNETNGSFAKGFEEVGPRVRELLTDEEYDTARRSIQYAHYTSEKIIRPMWQAAQAMGFTGGKVFEPGMGTGNFLGMMPAEIAARTQYQGIEFDGITARIAQLLYPQSGIKQSDFTRGALPKDAFDLVIGNPPFSGTVVKSDPEYGKLGFVLHDFFFAKSLDAVRPGGLLMFVTSAGTMNKVGTEARAWMADRADLVGAVRLPGGAFRENAGTDVTTDIVVLRKRAPGDAPGSRAWVDTTELTLPTRSGGTGPVEVSNYFVENPDQILGEHGLFDQLAAGERYGVRMREGANMTADLTRALDTVAAGTRIEQRDAVAETATAEFDMDSTERKEGSFYVGKDGRLMQHRNGLGSPVQSRGKGVTGGIAAEAQERIKALVPIRDALRTVLGHDMAGRSEQATAARATLNSAYDRFVQQFGPINKAEIRYQRPSVIEQESARAAAREETRLMGGFFNEGDFVADDPNAKLAELARARTAAREAAAAMGREFDEGDFDPAELPDKVIVKRPNVDAFMDDQEGYRLRSIEHYNDDTGEAQKGPVFYKNVVSQDRAPEIRSSGDALLYVLNRTGRPDIDEIAMRAGISRDQVLEELADKVFKIPGQGETYQTREQYLSGNVRAKLVTAQAAAARDADFRHNVAALEAVQPRPLGPTDISASLGMPWIPEGVIAEFAKTLGLNNVAIRYRPKLAQWSAHGNAFGAAATSEWGTSRRDAIALLGDALNRQTPIIYDNFRDADGKEQRVRNDTETVAAQDKMRAILARFKDWVWEDAKRATDLVSLYNTEYNNLVAPVYDGGYLTTPGIAEGWSWRPHQQRVVSRIIQSGNTYMAHAVGAGKTSAMIGAGMEMRRLGLVRKPMYVVPNHMLGQFTKEFYEQYPTAKIMVADEKQFHTDRRKQFVANVGTSDLDAVIITHSAFGFIPISEDFNEKLLRTQISEFRAILNELKDERSSGDQSQRITVRNIEQQIESMEQKIRGRKKRSDQVFTFEETGIDFLFVDEAHLFRKLDFATKMSNVRGVDPNGSGMSYDLFAKTRYLEEQAPGRSHVLASGTPVTNTMAELFSVQRYLQPQELAARALGQFDAWAGAFGETVTQLEQDPAGGYKPVTRFAKFVNVPELSAMVRQVMDVVTSRELEQYVVRPKLLGGSRKMIVSNPTPALDEFQASLAARMQAIEQRKGKPKKGDDILLSVIGDGRKAAIDMRLVNPAIREEGKSKLETLIDNVSRIAKETEDHPFYKAEATGYAAEPFMRGRATQMVFSDLGINGDFQVHRYMRQQFIARGLKDSEVAIISDYKTSVARQRLFNDMNEGKVRVLIGSVPKMGTGVNAQKRLYAIHNLDPQWYPANDEQRNGRGLRQGNMNRELGIFDYSTKATYDSTMWGLMETKARFIEGFFNGDPTMRSMEDLGEASQYEQAKALTTTDPRILELTQDKQDLERAMLRRAAFDRDLYAVRERITSAEARIDRLTAALPLREADLAQRQDLTGDNFAAKVGAKTFTDRTEFGEAMLDRLNELAAGGLSLRDRTVGEISGFKLTADVAMYGKGEAQVALYLNRNGDVQERVKAESALGISSSAGAIMRGFEGDIQEAKDGIERAKRDIAEYTPQTTKTFTGEAEIAELERRVAEMEDTLTKEAATRASVRAAPAPAALPDGAKLSIDDDAISADADAYMESDYEALRAKLAAQAKRMGVGGDRLVTSVVSKIMNDDRIAGMYFNGVITVATDVRASPERTFNHEFIHALKDMGLFRDAEWTVLSREARTDPKLMKKIAVRYPNLDEEGRIEEAVAEMFADWKGERTGFRGAALGRIRDFIDAIRRLVRGVDTSGDIMRRINRGTVGRRAGAVQGSGARFSDAGPTESAAFKRWFGDSKVVDDSGNPLVVYHGTSRSFDTFNAALQGDTFNNVDVDVPRDGFWFASEPARSDWYANTAAANDGGSANLMPVYVSLKNPYTYTAEQFMDEGISGLPSQYELEKDGYDGVIVERAEYAGEDSWDHVITGRDYAAFRPAQVKSAIGNNGSFDPSNTDIRFSILGSSAANPNPQTVTEATERAKTFVGNMAERYDSFRIAMQDRMLPVLRAQTAVERVIGRELTDAEQPYLAEELMTGRVGAKLGHLTEDHIEPLMNALEAEKISVEEIESFLYAKHAPERNAYIASVNTDFAQGEGSGMTDIEAAAILARIDATGKTRQFERVADRVYALLQFSRDERADAGLLSAEQLDSWNSAYKFYVPLRGFAELDSSDARPNTGGAGITVRGAESKKAFGRRSKADDILAHSIMQAEEAITRGEKNRVARAFYDLAKASPDDDFWKINKVTMERRMNPLTGLVESYPVRALLARDADMTVSLKIDGKEARVTMNEKNPQARKLAASMRHLDEQKTSGALVYLSKWNRFLSTANTSLSADFIVTNAFRDMQTAAVNLAGIDLPGLQKRVAKDYRKAFVASMKGSFDKGSGPWADAWTEYADAGGRIYYNQMQDVAGITRDFEKRFDPKRKLTGANTAPKQLAMIAYGDMKAAFEFIEKVNNGVENSVRLATFKNARELGASPDQAASIARNLTVNFTRKGEKAVLVNSMYLFYNASIQGSARLLMALKHPKVQKIVAGIVVAGALQELLSMFISPDDDDGEKVYDKIPEFQKSRNMIVMVKGPWGDYLAIPMPYGYSAFHTLGRNMVRAMRPGEKPLDAGIDTLKAFVDGFNPVGSGSLLNMIAPTFVDPLVDLTQNRDFADRPIMPDQNQFGPETPDNQRYWNSVNPVWKGVTDTLNTATGGDKVIPGAVDVSPETLEYLFGVVTGAAGAQVSRAVGGAAKMVDGDADTALGLGDLPVVRKIAGKKPEWYDKAAFYARVGEVEQKIDNTKKYAQSGDKDAVKAYVAKELPSLGLMDISRAAKKAMSDIRQAKGALDQAKEKKTIDAATYTERKKKLTDSEKTVILAFNKAYLKAIDEPLRP
jgi:N12 class adenine-specific DNA methylase